MTKRDFFRLITRLLGLYLFYQSTTITFSRILMYIEYGTRSDSNIFVILVTLATFVVMTGLSSVLIFCTDTIIDWLRLDKGYDDERVEIKNVDSFKILSLAILIIGGFLIVGNVISALGGIANGVLSWVLRWLIPFGGNHYYDSEKSLSAIFNMLVGIVLLTNRNRITTYLLKGKGQKSEGTE